MLRRSFKNSSVQGLICDLLGIELRSYIAFMIRFFQCGFFVAESESIAPCLSYHNCKDWTIVSCQIRGKLFKLSVCKIRKNDTMSLTIPCTILHLHLLPEVNFALSSSFKLKVMQDCPRSVKFDSTGWVVDRIVECMSNSPDWVQFSLVCWNLLGYSRVSSFSWARTRYVQALKALDEFHNTIQHNITTSQCDNTV